MTHDVFISYSTNDQTIVEGVSHYLEQNGIRCFVAYRDIPRGVVWAAAITEAIEISKLMIVVFSEHFNRSPQVDREIEMCIEEGKPILTFKIQNAPFTGAKKYYLKNINWIDAFPNPNECFGLLLESVKKLLPQNTQENQTPTPKNEPTTTPQTSEPKPENTEIITQSPVSLLKVRPNLTCEIWIDGELITEAQANSITKIPLNKGTFWLEFVSVENKEDKFEREFTVTNQEELIVVDLESVVNARIEKERQSDFWIEMVYVQGGTFMMGATSEQGSDCRDNEKPVHQVTLSDYYIGKYQVTQKQWEAVMGNNPSKFKGDNLPVEMVSWDDTQEFIKRLNMLTGKKYRLPTDAEWEYAARGGNKSRGYKYSGSNNINDVAWYEDNSDKKTHPVGTKQPNELSIYDMNGNVWELCNDWYGDYSNTAKTNPMGPSSGSYRVFRGGGWYNSAEFCRVSYRERRSPGAPGTSLLGFRVVLP